MGDNTARGRWTLAGMAVLAIALAGCGQDAGPKAATTTTLAADAPLSKRVLDSHNMGARWDYEPRNEDSEGLTPNALCSPDTRPLSKTGKERAEAWFSTDGTSPFIGEVLQTGDQADYDELHAVLDQCVLTSPRQPGPGITVTATKGSAPPIGQISDSYVITLTNATGQAGTMWFVIGLHDDVLAVVNGMSTPADDGVEMTTDQFHEIVTKANDKLTA